jgi:hypothetical protein
MAFTAGFTVTVGNPTKKADLDKVAANTDWLQAKADVDHDFNTSTGTGYHTSLTYTSPIQVVTPALHFEAPLLVHTMTNILAANEYASMGYYNSTNGGLNLWAISNDPDTPALTVVGVLAGTDPTDTTAAIWLYGGKQNGLTWQALGADETVFQLTNYTTNLFTIMGDGDINTAATVLSFNTAAQIDTSGNNILTLTSGSAHLDITTGLLDVTGPLAVSGTAGIGIATPDGKCHIWSATAGTVTASGLADELVLENNDFCGLSILTPADKTAYIVFGDPDDNDRGWIAYNHATDYMIMGVGASAFVSISSLTLELSTGGSYYVNSTGVAHGMTSFVPTNTQGAVRGTSTSDGGLTVEGISDLAASATGLSLTGIIANPDPTDTVPAVLITGAKGNGTTWQALGSAETVLQLKNTSTALLTVLGSGRVNLVGTYLAPLWFGTDKCIWNDGAGSLRTNTTAPNAADNGNLLVEG